MTRLAIDRLGAGAGNPLTSMWSRMPHCRNALPVGRTAGEPARANLQGVERVTVRSPEASERQEEAPASLAGADPAIDASNAIASRAHLLSQLAERSLR